MMHLLLSDDTMHLLLLDDIWINITCDNSRAIVSSNPGKNFSHTQNTLCWGGLSSQEKHTE